MLKITNAKFITSAADKSKFITGSKPVIAVCGKSNVGKSSFINMLAGNGKLAKTSKTPGRTRLVNYFDMGSFILADLPGYGFARVSFEEKAKWARLMEDFFADKSNVCHVLALCDIRHEPTADDVNMANFLYSRVIPFTIVATKSDKLSRAQIKSSLLTIASTYKCGAGDITACSAVTRQGLEDILGKISQIIAAHQGE